MYNPQNSILYFIMENLRINFKLETKYGDSKIVRKAETENNEYRISPVQRKSGFDQVFIFIGFTFRVNLIVEPLRLIYLRHIWGKPRYLTRTCLKEAESYTVSWLELPSLSFPWRRRHGCKRIELWLIINLSKEKLQRVVRIRNLSSYYIFTIFLAKLQYKTRFF